MICSASDFSSSGLSGALSSDTNSPFTRIVAGRPTFKSRSDAFRWTIWVMAALKLKVGLLGGASGMGVDSEKGLSELDGLRVLHQHLPDYARHLGLDFVHDLHRLDDAHYLARRHAAARLDVGPGPRPRRRVTRPHHGRLDLQEGRGRSGDAPPPTPPPRPTGPPLGPCGARPRPPPRCLRPAHGPP